MAPWPSMNSIANPRSPSKYLLSRLLSPFTNSIIRRRDILPPNKYSASSFIHHSSNTVADNPSLPLHPDALHTPPPSSSSSSEAWHLNDGKRLYSAMTTAELMKTLFNLYLVSSEVMLDMATKVLRSPLLMSEGSPFRKPILTLVKRTAYSHFCAGEDVEEASATLKRMWELGLRSILDYSIEDALDSSSCDRNLQGFLKTIEQMQHLPQDSVSFACTKITALCPLPLLERMSDLLRWQHKAELSNGLVMKLPWKEESLPVLAPQSPTYHIQSLPEPLSEAEERGLYAAKERLWKLCQKCEEYGLPLLVDAEYTSVQPAIDYLTYIAAIEFNRMRGKQPLVYGTIQAYLKDSMPRLAMASEEALRRGISFGVKLVRGAYITRESALAASKGFPSPIHSRIEDTHRCYDSCAAFMLERATSREVSVVLATHNIDSGRSAARKAEEVGLRKEDMRLHFAQLKGMSDGLSLALVHAGFQVSKYLPFGPVGHVIPYLVRRAEENRGLLSNTLAERLRIRKELTRRLFESS